MEPPEQTRLLHLQHVAQRRLVPVHAPPLAFHVIAEAARGYTRSSPGKRAKMPDTAFGGSGMTTEPGLSSQSFSQKSLALAMR